MRSAGREDITVITRLEAFLPSSPVEEDVESGGNWLQPLSAGLPQHQSILHFPHSSVRQ